MKPPASRELFATLPLLVQLQDRILARIAKNAASHYTLEPSLPAPEVFERPGWTVRWVAPGACTYRVACMVEDSPFSVPLADSPLAEEPLPVQIREILPLETGLAEVPGSPYPMRWGIGFDVDTRCWFVFQLGLYSPDMR